MKLIMAQTYDIDLEDWAMDCINKVTKTFGEISSCIHLWLQHLQDEQLEEIQQFQNTKFQSPAQ